MTREHWILIGFIVLFLAVFTRVVKKGIRTRGGMCAGVLSMIGLSVMAIGLHCYLSTDASLCGDSAVLPLQEMGLGLLFLLLASVGCFCSGCKN